ncbi:hypothetical protein GCM10027064_01770 [Microbacterium petrolearium]
MNDLIATDAGDFLHTYESLIQDPLGSIASNIPIAAEIVSAAREFGEGDWASGLIAVGAGVASTAAAVIDPFGTLASSVASFLLDYVPPLPMQLDLLAGNPALVESLGQTWTNVSGALELKATEIQQLITESVSVWVGAAGDAYREALSRLHEAAAGLAVGAAGIGSGMIIASEVVAAIRDLAKAIIADLVGKLIIYVIETVASGGIALPAVITQACTAIAKTAGDVATVMDELVTVISKGAMLADELVEAIGAIQKALATLVALGNVG